MPGDSSQTISASSASGAALDLFNAYYKLFSTRDNADICWWYCGTVSSHVDGLGEVPVSQAETLMVFHTEHPSPDVLKITWKEVGYFRDIATGEVLQSWFNPFTGVSAVRAQGFEDGPAFYTITRQGSEVSVELVQSHARIEGVELSTVIANGQIGFVQTENKTRTYQRADGSWPDVDSPEATSIQTVLSIFGSVAEVEDASLPAAAARGFYHSGSRGKGSGAWSGTVVRGIMQKAAVDEQLNPGAWKRLNQLYPGFFRNGRVDPGWN